MGKVIHFPKKGKRKPVPPHMGKVMAKAVQQGFLGEQGRKILSDLNAGEPGLIILPDKEMAALVMAIAEESWVKGATEAVLAMLESDDTGPKPRFSKKKEPKK